MKKNYKWAKKAQIGKTALGLLMFMALIMVLPFASELIDGALSFVGIGGGIGGLMLGTLPFMVDGKFKDISLEALEKLTKEEQGEYKVAKMAAENARNALIDKTIKEHADKHTKNEADNIEMQKTLKEMSDLIRANAEKGEKLVDKLSIADGILKFFSDNNIKSRADLTKFSGEAIELKADNPILTTNYTGDYSRTQTVGPPKYPRLRKLGFLDKISVQSLGEGKSILLYTDGAFTVSVGYAGENVENTQDGSTGSETDATRKMAKIQARMFITNETFEDLPQFAARMQAKITQEVTLWLDGMVLNGDGDIAEPTHLWGLINGNVTAFNAATAPKTKKANEADLAVAAQLQAEVDSEYMPEEVWMSPTLKYKLSRTKDLNGQYLINKLVTGEDVMEGMIVHTSKLFLNATVESMLVGTSDLIQLWIKRNLETKFVDEPKFDRVEMYLYYRGQLLVEPQDIKGLIYIANVATDLATITAP
jgi:hypothetical protein